jgi:CheY-like chemotaxis protein
MSLFDLFAKKLRNASEKTILIVDDGEVERHFIERTLRKRGFNTVSAVDGPQALTVLEDRKVDLILLDFSMPGMKGDEVCAKIKANDSTKHIPVIFLTGSASSHDLLECYEKGAEYYLNKPITGAALCKQVEMIFKELDNA